MRPYWARLGKGIAMGSVLGLVALIPPYLSKVLIDGVYPSRDWTLLGVIVVGMFSLAMLQALLSAIRGYYTMYVTSHLSTATTLLFFNHLQHLRPRFFEEHRVGEVMSRFSDVRGALSGVSRVLGTVFVQGLYLVVVPPFLFLLHWKLALIALVTMPFAAVIRVATARKIRDYHKKSAEAFADLNAYQVEVLSQIRSLKTFAPEHDVFGSAKRLSEDALSHQLRSGWFGQLVTFSTALVTGLGVALYTWYGWAQILNGALTLGSFIAFTAYLGYLRRPIAAITGTFTGFQQTAVYLQRMFEYLDESPEQDPTDVYEPRPPVGTRLAGWFETRDLSFGYLADQPVLESIDVGLQPGEATAIVGESGAGKSSLLRLIACTEKPTSGKVLVDGVPMTEWSVSDLRRQITVVWQDMPVLKGTLWHNMTFGAENPTRSAVEDAARVCRLDEFIRDLPEGYETPVAEWGASLSAGQKQRIALARALVRDTPVLFLDEATANIDLAMESEILREIIRIWQNRTLVFVTHRVPTTRLADRVLVLDSGRIVATGTHTDLAAESEIFHRLHGLTRADRPAAPEDESMAGSLGRQTAVTLEGHWPAGLD